VSNGDQKPEFLREFDKGQFIAIGGHAFVYFLEQLSMNNQFGDARLEELKLLSRIDRDGSFAISASLEKKLRDLICALIVEEFVTDSSLQWTHEESMTESKIFYCLPGESELERTLHGTRINLLSRVLGQKDVRLELTHLGRVRLSELSQALRSGREREPFGILWDVRHWEQDVQIAILDANAKSPLALAYLDMNGLKDINDKLGHDSGDIALKSYFQAVESVIGDRGQAYRLGGDEVLVVLPGHDTPHAVEVLETICRKLMSERFDSDVDSISPSIAAGLVITNDPMISPKDLRHNADMQQKRAKNRSKQENPRPSVIAMGAFDTFKIIEHCRNEIA
jgi:diguanylate cyclase (GGDEF)-like protein